MATILETLEGPADLRRLSRGQLAQLAQEVRDEICRVVATNGGHLASNLGAVELTIALHYCFDFRRDALLWDVGHQTYTHKLLTGRRAEFPTLRRQGGLSGFPNKHESPYDLFTTGHAGTAISSALGLACADELAGRERRIVAVLGDGSLTSGLALAALNHAGALGKDLLVVLNDNKMSISMTVGALAQHLDRLRSAHFYNAAKREVHRLLDRMSTVGSYVEAALGHLKEGLKAALLPETLFEQLGFRTFGPVDGHSFDDLVELFEAVRGLTGPVLVHVVTEKGRGHAAAVSDPTRYHSASPKPVREAEDEEEPAAAAPPRPSYTSVLAPALCRLAREDPRIVAVSAAMGEGTGLVAFAREFPRRFFDVGICEEHAVAFAGGLSVAGCKPVVGIYSTFLQRAYDQIFHDVALQEAGLVLCLDRAGLVGGDGPSHQGVFDIAYLRHLPGLVLSAPKDGAELEAMLAAAVASGRPWAIRFPKAPIPARAWPSAPIEVGRGELLRDGSDAALVAYGSLVEPAFAAAERLAEEGIEAAVVNARFAKPIDTELVREVASRVPLLVTVEEHVLQGGFGSAVLESLAAGGGCPCRVECLGVPDRFIEHGKREDLLAELGLDVAGIAARVAGALSGVAQGQAGHLAGIDAPMTNDGMTNDE